MKTIKYEDEVRTNFKRMETAEITERMRSGALTESAHQIAVEELKLRTDAGGKSVNSLSDSVDGVSSSENAPALGHPKYAVIFALAAVLVLALYLGLLRDKPQLETVVAKAFAQGLAIAVVIFLVFFTNSGLNWYRKKNGRPLRSFGQDAGTMVVWGALIVIIVSSVFIVFG